MEASFTPDASRMVEEAKEKNELLPMAESSTIASNACIEFLSQEYFIGTILIQNNARSGEKQSERNLEI